MNRNGFTLIELLGVIVLLGVIASISIVTVNYGLEEAKKETEKVFVKTLRDAISMYLDSDEKNLKFASSKSCEVVKLLDTVNVYEGKKDGMVITFNEIIGSKYQPIMESDMVNPANEKKCNVNAKIRIYRDENYVYYYKFKGSDLGCLVTNTGIISNFPEGTGNGCLSWE